ncbi:MAG: hypothetical protein LQ351_002539 [Letrouitia transgressa]|nr:MAG: hypothetical protein LQ351_002539 [Letrouitia transgressa]
MPTRQNGELQRSSSTASTRSHRPGTVRSRSRKQSLVTPSSAKSLVSFPSLSPDNSPGPVEGNYVGTSPRSANAPYTPLKSRAKAPSIVDALVRKTSSFRGRSALFDDSPKSNGKDIPGALHLASDEHIQHLIAKNGPIALVRQLAEDLADRDAEMTAIRRKTEERERELKSMLREVEVSNLDIETRLHHVGQTVEEALRKHPSSAKAVPGRKGGTRETLSSITNGIDQMVGEAMREDVGTNIGGDEGFFRALEEQDRQATIRAAGLKPKDGDRRSTDSSLESHDKSKGTTRGWREFLWSGNGTSRKTSGASSIASEYNEEAEAVSRVGGLGSGNNRRKGLDEDLFNSPRRSSTTQSRLENNGGADAQSQKSSTSMASWTMKLFAGNPQAGRDTNSAKTVRGRSATTGSRNGESQRAPSTASAQTSSSAMASLNKVKSNEPSTRTVRKTVAPLPLGSNSNLRGTSSHSAAQLPSTPKSVGKAENLGPVEMDTILPLETRPPTQTHVNNMYQNSDLLTDRFGFIYDQRRRKRESDCLNSSQHKHTKSMSNSGLEMLRNPRDLVKSTDRNEESSDKNSETIAQPNSVASTEDKAEGKPTKRWQDYLNVATFPTELLSHTPASKPLMTVTLGESPSPGPVKRSPTLPDARGSLPSSSVNPEPSASPITVHKAEMAKPTTTQPNSVYPVTAENEPVKLLLNQLTELHDSLQKERSVKWNEFLRKVRAERKKEGETADSRFKGSMPEVALTDGEVIGVAGLGNRGKVGRAKWKEFKQLVLAGIPVSYRAKIWAECSGASALRIPGYYEDLLNNKNDQDDPSILAQIEMDIHRTLTDNVFFRKGPGVVKLNEVLLAYSRRNPEVGYCQGMNLITASLLLIMPTAEDAFWILTSIVENILPRHYYDHSLLASRADQQVLRSYVTEILPKLSAHLDQLGIELEALTFQWFLSLFTDCLSAEALYRVWDVVFCFNDGSTFLFQVALALLKLNEGSLLGLESAGAVYGYIGHEMTDHAISIDGLVAASEGLKGVVKREEIEERRTVAVDEGKAREMQFRNGNFEGRTKEGVATNGSGQSAELSMNEPNSVEEAGSMS